MSSRICLDCKDYNPDPFLLQAKDAFLAKTQTPVLAASPEPDEREGETQWERILTNTQR